MNEIHGAELGVKLKELLIVGSDRIPEMAEIYGEANRSIATTRIAQDQAFSGGNSSRIYESWTALRDAIQDIFGETQTNLKDTASTIVGIVNVYSSQDEAAAQGLRDAVAEQEGLADPSLPTLPHLGDGKYPVVILPDNDNPIPSEWNYQPDRWN